MNLALKCSRSSSSVSPARSIKESNRPYIMGALLLALYRSERHLTQSELCSLSGDPHDFVRSVSASCKRAFSIAGKEPMGRALLAALGELVEDPNDAVEAVAVRKIYSDLKVRRSMQHAAGSDADELGQFYETFFSYAGAAVSPLPFGVDACKISGSGAARPPTSCRVSSCARIMASQCATEPEAARAQATIRAWVSTSRRAGWRT